MGWHVQKCKEGGGVYLRYAPLVLGIVMGSLGLAATEAAWLGVLGVTVHVNRREIGQDFAPIMNALISPMWPSLRKELKDDMRPLVDVQISQLMSHLRVSVDGVSFAIPKTAQESLKDRLLPMINQQMTVYLKRQFTPQRVVEPLVSHLVPRQPVTITINLGPVPLAVHIVPESSHKPG